MQGILPIQPFSAKIHLRNICEFSSLRFGPEQGIWFEIDSRAPTGIAEGRLVRAQASIDSRGTDRLELSAETLCTR
jgi:hypothetical protein